MIQKNHFCTSSKKLFLNNGKCDNHWVGYPVMKQVGAESFQRINTPKKEARRNKNHFDIEILEEYDLSPYWSKISTL